ncbi:MAG: phenylalanine--tRNA ligase subunit beta, partial [Proteobacteria bacterium]|nr:phenylalanine--tRNA ligase subunit beta [Pseudomonadota bacterium]
LSVILKDSVNWHKVRQNIETVTNQSGQILVDVVLFDVFKGENIESGYKSLAIGMIFQEKSRTLEDKEVDKLLAKAVSCLTVQFNAEIRGVK